MGFDANIDHLRVAFWHIILTAGPLLSVALGIGLLVGIIQAATSINEMTLSFVPKVVSYSYHGSVATTCSPIVRLLFVYFDTIARLN